MNKRFNGFVKNNAVVLSGVIILIVVHVLVMLIYGYAPFGDGVYVKGDNISLSASINELKNKFADNESIYYTWRVAGGGSFWYILAHSLSNITMLPLIFVPLKLFNGALSIYYIILSIAMYITMTYYLSHRYSQYVLSKNSPELLIFSLPYALSPAFVNISVYCPYTAVFVLVPLLVLGLERFFHDEGFKLYFISLSIIYILNFYIAFICSIFVILYYFTFEFDNIKHFINKSISVLLLSICAVGVSSFIIVPITFDVLGGGYGLTKTADFGFMSTLTYMFRQSLWGNMPVLAGSSDNTRFECNLYIGVFTEIMLISYLVNRNDGIRIRIKRAVVFLIMILSFSESFTNYLFHMCHYTCGVPNRQTLLFLFFCLVIACDNYASVKNKKRKNIAIVTVVSCALMLIPTLLSKLSLLIVSVNVLLIISYCGLIAFKIRKKAVILTIIVIVEASAGYVMMFNNSPSNRTYFKETYEVKSMMDHIDDDTFYFASYNDMDVKTNMGLLCGYNSISGYSNAVREGYVNALSSLGINSYKNNIRDRGYNSFLNSVFSRKYIIENKNIDHTYDLADRNYYTFDKINENDELELYMNRNVLSPIVLSNNSMNDFSGLLTDIDKQHGISNMMNSLVRDLTGVEESVKEVKVSPEITFCDNCLGEFYEDYLVFIPDVDSNGDDYNPSDSSIIQLSFEAPIAGEYIVDVTNNYCAGYYNKGDIVNVNARITNADYNRETGVYATDISINVLDIEKYREAYSILKDKQMTITEYRSDKLSGIIKSDKGSTVFTVIPYDPSWRVTVDGISVKSRSIGNAFLAFEIDSGEHTVSLQYKPRGLVLGAIMSFACIFIFVLISVIMRKGVTHR